MTLDVSRVDGAALISAGASLFSALLGAVVGGWQSRRAFAAQLKADREEAARLASQTAALNLIDGLLMGEDAFYKAGVAGLAASEVRRARVEAANLMRRVVATNTPLLVEADLAARVLAAERLIVETREGGRFTDLNPLERAAIDVRDRADRQAYLDYVVDSLQAHAARQPGPPPAQPPDSTRDDLERWQRPL